MRFDIFSDAHLEFFYRYTDEAFQAYWQAVFGRYGSRHRSAVCAYGVVF